MATETINIFIAYAREDATYLQELRDHLYILERNKAIKIWYDGEIIAGEAWNEVIERELERADIFIILLSAAFLKSKYGYDKEMFKALERHNKGDATLIPIVARACAWNRTPLAALQAPVQGKPLANVQGGARDQLYAKIVDAIAEVVEQLQSERTKRRAYFADTEAWDNALTLSSISGYNRYLKQHPQGRHTAQARKAIADIERKQQQDKEDIERKAWQAAKQQNTIAAYRAYLQKSPNGRFVANANTAIQFIEKDRTRQAENAEREAYQNARTSHSLAAYRQYLVNYPKGKYASAAQKAIRRLEQPPSPVNGWRVGLIALAVLFLSLVLWQGTAFFSKNDAKEVGIVETSFIEPTMIKVTGGTFTMGCKEGRDKDCYDNEKPAHEVSLSTYYIGKYEVTNEEFCVFLNEKGNEREGGKKWVNLSGSYKNVVCGIEQVNGKFKVKKGREKHPMVYVSWYGANAYCKWISGKTRQNYRLPTEAEWEFAARGGNSSLNYLYSGSDNIGDVAWYDGNSGSNTHPVGKKKANELGIHDMSGNVWEWCSDWYGDYSATAQKNPKGAASGTYRVLRGGSWVGYAR